MLVLETVLSHLNQSFTSCIHVKSQLREKRTRYFPLRNFHLLLPRSVNATTSYHPNSLLAG